MILHGRPNLEARHSVNRTDPLKIAHLSTATGQLLRRLSDSGLPVEQSGPFDLLPSELIWVLLECLTTADLMRVSRVNRRFFAIAYQVSSPLAVVFPVLVLWTSQGVSTHACVSVVSLCGECCGFTCVRAEGREAPSRGQLVARITMLVPCSLVTTHLPCIVALPLSSLREASL